MFAERRFYITFEPFDSVFMAAIRLCGDFTTHKDRIKKARGVSGRLFEFARSQRNGILTRSPAHLLSDIKSNWAKSRQYRCRDNVQARLYISLFLCARPRSMHIQQDSISEHYCRHLFVA